MDDPSEVLVLHPFFVVFSSVTAPIFLVPFVMGVGWDPTRMRKKHPNQAIRPRSLEITKMPLGPNPGPENQYKGHFLEQHTDETPCWHGAMEVVGLPSVTHAYLAAFELSVTNMRPH